MTDNPFPANAVATTSLAGLANYPTSYFEDAEKKVADFALGFGRSENPAYLVMGIRGKYGSGKTHLALQLLDAVSAECRKKGAAALTIHSKAEKTEILAVYTGIAARLREVDLKALAAGYYRKVLKEKSDAARRRRTDAAAPEGGSAASLPAPEPAAPGVEPSSDAPPFDPAILPSTMSLPEIAAEAEREFGTDNPEYILALARKNLLPSDDFLALASRDLSNTDPDALEDFQHAYSAILEKESPPAAALKWIQGQKLSEKEAESLSLKIDCIGPDQARGALKFLLTAYRRAQVAVAFCLDEFERLTVPPAEAAPTPADSAQDSSVRKLLKDLAEIFQQAGQVLVLSGTDQAWLGMKEDVFGRIAWDNIVRIQLNREDAVGILKTCVEGQRLKLRDVFDGPAIELLLDVSEFNTRRLLQVAYHSFAAARSLPVSTDDIRKSTAQALGDAERTEKVKSAVRKVATETHLGMSVVENRGEPTAILLGDDTTPSIAVHLMRSLFKVEEVRDAWSIASRTVETAQTKPQLRACAVVVGYSSDAIRSELSKSVDRVLVYDEDRFPDDFRDFVQWATRASRAPERKAPDPKAYTSMQEGAAEQEARVTAAAQQARTASTARVDEYRRGRAGERILALLSSLAWDLRKEEAKSWERGPELGREALEALLSEIVDHQRALLRDLLYLNQGLHEAPKFAEIVEYYRTALDSSEDIWMSVYKEGWDRIKTLEMSIKDRRGALAKMEAAQMARADQDRLGAFAVLAPALRWPVWMRALLLVSVAGMAGFISAGFGAWQTQNESSRQFSTAIASVRTSLDGVSDSLVAGGKSEDARQTVAKADAAWRRARNDFEFTSVTPGTTVLDKAGQALSIARSKFAEGFSSSSYTDDASGSLRDVQRSLGSSIVGWLVLGRVLTHDWWMLLPALCFGMALTMLPKRREME